MSLESMAIAFNHSAASGTAKVVLLGIASHDGDGGAWPAISTLARYAHVDARSVQRAINRLEELGEIQRVDQGGGSLEIADYRRPNLYLFLLKCPPWCDRTSQHRDSRKPLIYYPNPVEKLSTGVTPVSPGGVTPVSPELNLRTSKSIKEKKLSSQPRARAIYQDCIASFNGFHEWLESDYCLHCGERKDLIQQRREGVSA